MPYPTPSSSFLSRLPLAFGALAVAATLAGCAITLPDSKIPQTAEAQAAVPPPPGDVLATAQRLSQSNPIREAQTYRGVIPCADCTGQRVTLTLLPDWTWRMRRTYFGTRDGKDQTFISTGRWERSLDNLRQIRVIGDRNDTATYEVTQNSALRLVDQDGEPARSALNYSLTQQFDSDLITEPFAMRGRVTSTEGKTTIALCGTGKTYPVASTGQGQALADAYSKLRVAPGTSVLMWVDGRIVSSGQPPVEQVEVQNLSRGTLNSPCES